MIGSHQPKLKLLYQCLHNVSFFFRENYFIVQILQSEQKILASKFIILSNWRNDHGSSSLISPYQPSSSFSNSQHPSLTLIISHQLLSSPILFHDELSSSIIILHKLRSKYMGNKWYGFLFLGSCSRLNAS